MVLRIQVKQYLFTALKEFFIVTVPTECILVGNLMSANNMAMFLPILDINPYTSSLILGSKY